MSTTPERIVRGGKRPRNTVWADVFMAERLRAELRTTRTELTRLRAAALNWANARGLEGEPKHLHELLRVLGKSVEPEGGSMRRVLSLLFVLLLSPVLLFAQAAEPMPDPKAALAQLILVATPVLGMFFVWGAKYLLAKVQMKVPANLVLLVVPFLGMGINFALNSLAELKPADPLIAALISMAATWLRELATTAPKGAAAVSVTKGML